MIAVQLYKNAPCAISGIKIRAMVTEIARYEKKIQGEVEITLVSIAEMHRLNKLFRGVNKPTDVLSFAWQEDKFGPKSTMLGQVYLCYSYIADQAKRFKVKTREEFARMLAHGLLHIVGYDHQEEDEAKIMFALQEKIVKNIAKNSLY